MKLSQMKYIVAIHKYGGMNRAAEKLFIAQPTLSVSVKELEKELGICLIERNTGGIKFTEAGEQFVEEAEKILGMVDRLTGRMRSMSDNRYEIRIGFSPAMSKQIVPLLMIHVEKFMKKHSNVDVTMVERDYNKQFEALKSGKTTMAFGKGMKKKEPELAYIPLMTESAKLCVGPMHLLADRKTVALEEIVNENILTFLKPDSKTNMAIYDWANQKGYKIKSKYYSQSSVVEELIRLGMGVALLPHRIYCNNPGIRYIEIEDPIMLEYGMFYVKRKGLNEEERTLISLIRDILNE